MNVLHFISTPYYMVEYDDGDREEFDEAGVRAILFSGVHTVE